VSDEVEFRPDLYRGAAEDYDRYRLPYPPTLVADLAERAGLDGRGAALDVGCGTGQVAFAVRPYVAEVVGIDQEPDMITVATRKTASMRIDGMEWKVSAAEDFVAEHPFRLVTIGNAFHRMKRSRVAAAARQWLRSGGDLALVWASTPLLGDAGWQRVVRDCAAEWADRLGVSDRVPSNWESDIEQRPHAQVLADAEFDVLGRRDFTAVYERSLTEVAGFVYSTSLLPRSVVGDHSDDFEQDLATRLIAIEPSGVFREEMSAAYDLARSP
jgi:SAM-dependent methyltransferase